MMDIIYHYYLICINLLQLGIGRQYYYNDYIL